MRIQYCSDLHLELEQNRRYLERLPLSVSGEILILAGDIVPLLDEYITNPFFDSISKNYRQVFWVPGNHEYYHKNISDYSSSFNIQLFPNINIVNNIDLNFEGIHFVFSTLWSRISQQNKKLIERSVSDFECISQNNKRFNANEYNKLHEAGLEFIKRSIIGKKNKTVVVTHHLPSVLCNSAVHNASAINEAFCVDLTDFIEESNADFWIYGHSHFNQKPLFIGDTMMLTNQLGYIQLNEQGSFKRNAYFSV